MDQRTSKTERRRQAQRASPRRVSPSRSRTGLTSSAELEVPNPARQMSARSRAAIGCSCASTWRLADVQRWWTSPADGSILIIVARPIVNGRLTRGPLRGPFLCLERVIPHGSRRCLRRCRLPLRARLILSNGSSDAASANVLSLAATALWSRTISPRVNFAPQSSKEWHRTQRQPRSPASCASRIAAASRPLSRPRPPAA